jgi:hypothetical protein
MSSSPLSTYLNDHLAGSAGALDLLESLHGHANTDELAATLESVSADIEADRETLLGVMERLGVETSTIKQAAARVGEKALRVKTSTVVTGDDDLSRLLGLEALKLGIAGKESGWAALRAAEHDSLAGVDFDALIARAKDQRAQLEPFRLMAAAAAFRTAQRIS